jgi:hypothetical protein
MQALSDEIKRLSRELDDKKKLLFRQRLSTIYRLDPTISDIVIDTTATTWSITYEHTTDAFSPLNYLIEDEIDGPPDSKPAVNTVVFGRNDKKYFIKGCIKFSIYRNSRGDLRIINPEYEFDLDMEEQNDLINRYAAEQNIPESFALSVFKYISRNKWDDQSMITYLSVI